MYLKEAEKPAKGKIGIIDYLGRTVAVPCPRNGLFYVNSDVSEVIYVLGGADKIVGVRIPLIFHRL
jgi:ABC-type hemin transport system substrate-binding protein